MPNFEDVLDSFDGLGPDKNTPKRDLPNAQLAFALGLLSIFLGCCCGILGIGVGIAGLVISNNCIRAYDESPGLYFRTDYDRAKQARIFSIVGIALHLVMVAFSVFAQLL